MLHQHFINVKTIVLEQCALSILEYSSEDFEFVLNGQAKDICFIFISSFCKQDTGIGKTVNGFRKHDVIGESAKNLVSKWKKLVPQEVERYCFNSHLISHYYSSYYSLYIYVVIVTWQANSGSKIRWSQDYFVLSYIRV